MKKYEGGRMRKLRYKLLFIALAVAAVLVYFFYSFCRSRTDAYDILQKQRFVFIQNQDDLGQGNNVGAGFDLKDRELFFSYSSAIKDGILYGGKGNYEMKEYYRTALNEEISSILMNIKVTTEEIKKNNYQITRSPESLANKKLLKEKYPPEFELQYKYRKKRQFTKVRITYNKEFLPTRIEWYYKGEEGLKWDTWRTYSYPFKNKSDFDKRLDEEIETIKAIQEENKGD